MKVSTVRGLNSAGEKVVHLWVDHGWTRVWMCELSWEATKELSKTLGADALWIQSCPDLVGGQSVGSLVRSIRIFVDRLITLLRQRGIEEGDKDVATEFRDIDQALTNIDAIIKGG